MYRIELVFGHCCRNGKPLPSEAIAEAQETALHMFARLYYGGRLIHNTGSYQAADGTMMIEDCSVVWCDAPEISDDLWTEVFYVSQEISKTLQQEKVLLTITHLDGGPSTGSAGSAI